METWKCGLYEQLLLAYRLKLYALFIEGKKWDCPLQTVICYIEMYILYFKAGLTVYEKITRATKKIDPVTLNFDLENQ